MRPARAVHLAHRWLGLVLAAQVLLWMASGVIMSWFPIEQVRGETAAATGAPSALAAGRYVPPDRVIADFPGASDVRLRNWLGRPVYVVTGASGRALVDAASGEKLSPLGEDLARQAAVADYRGKGALHRLVLMTDPPAEYRGPSPVWRADFSDADETRLYISPQTGEVLARRNRIWRLYDFFWMLHIMDYEERENFNNPLIRAFSATGLLFALTGLFLVGVQVRSGRYRADAMRRRSPSP